jgi:hypothetical protein
LSVSNVLSVSGCSDHSCVLFNISVPLIRSPDVISIKTRSFKNVNFDNLAYIFDYHLVQPILWAMQTLIVPMEDLLGFFHSNAKTILDINVPVISRKVSTQPKWFNSSVRLSRRKLRRAERRWRKTKSLEDREVYKVARHEHHRVIITEKKMTARTSLDSCGTDYRRVWRQLNELTGRRNPIIVPKSISPSGLAQSFQSFFDQKIMSIRSSMVSAANDVVTPQPDVSNSQNIVLRQFDPASHAEVKKVILSIQNSSSELDPIPTHVIKGCLSVFLPLFTALANKIIAEGMPHQLKMAVIKPLIKKHTLDPEQLSSYRPVATIPFLAKVVEKLVSRRLVHYLNVAGCLDPNQHAYKAMHSCETALLTVINDALLAIDDGMVLPLILLDMTAAFDLVDHELFFDKCERLGIRESAIDWIRSYLCGRTQKVSCNGVESESSTLLCGVPQGSVLGPLFFSMYISDIRTVLQKHAVDCVIYADDIQLYTRSSPKDIFSVLLSLEACL